MEDRFAVTDDTVPLTAATEQSSVVGVVPSAGIMFGVKAQVGVAGGPAAIIRVAFLVAVRAPSDAVMVIEFDFVVVVNAAVVVYAQVFPVPCVRF
jgi:hypothetical protein